MTEKLLHRLGRGHRFLLKKLGPRLLISGATIGGALLFLAGPARAANYYWMNSRGDNLWSDGANWKGEVNRGWSLLLSGAEADFFQRHFSQSLEIAEALHGVKDLNACQDTGGVVVRRDSFGQVFGGHRCFFKTNVQSVHMRVIGNSHNQSSCSLSKIVNINRHNDQPLRFFSEDRPDLLCGIPHAIPYFLEWEIFTAFHTSPFNGFPQRLAYGFFDFVFGAAAIMTLLGGMTTQKNQFSDRPHRKSISKPWTFALLCRSRSIFDVGRMGGLRGLNGFK
jgi:hypothetical protein